MRSRFNLKSVFRLLFRKEQVEQELDEEVRFHVERQTEENLRTGMSLKEARRQALLELGAPERMSRIDQIGLKTGHLQAVVISHDLVALAVCGAHDVGKILQHRPVCIK